GPLRAVALWAPGHRLAARSAGEQPFSARAQRTPARAGVSQRHPACDLHQLPRACRAGRATCAAGPGIATDRARWAICAVLDPHLSPRPLWPAYRGAAAAALPLADSVELAALCHRSPDWPARCPLPDERGDRSTA